EPAAAALRSPRAPRGVPVLPPRRVDRGHGVVPHHAHRDAGQRRGEPALKVGEEGYKWPLLYGFMPLLPLVLIDGGEPAGPPRVVPRVDPERPAREGRAQLLGRGMRTGVE